MLSGNSYFPFILNDLSTYKFYKLTILGRQYSYASEADMNVKRMEGNEKVSTNIKGIISDAKQ